MEDLLQLLAKILDAERRGDADAASSRAWELRDLLDRETTLSPTLARALGGALRRQEVDVPPWLVGAEARPEQRYRARATGLVVDEDHRARVVEVRVLLEPVKGKPWTPQPMSEETTQAAALAVAAALGGRFGEWTVCWEVQVDHESPIYLKRSSLGLPLAVAVRAASRERVVPGNWAFTGKVGLHGDVAEVGSVSEKLLAAAEAGCTQVAVPRQGTAGLDPPPGVALERVVDLEELCDRLFPAHPSPSPRGRWGYLGFLAAVVLAAGLTYLLSGEGELDPGPVESHDPIPELAAPGTEAKGLGATDLEEPAPSVAAPGVEPSPATAGPPGEDSATKLCFLSGWDYVPRSHVYAAGERFGLWANLPAEGELAVLHREPGGLVQVLYPIERDPRRVPGGIEVLVPSEAHVKDVWTIDEKWRLEELVLLWTEGTLAALPTLRELVAHPPETASGWARAFPGAGPPALPSPSDVGGREPCTTFAWSREDALVARVSLRTEAASRRP